MLLRRIYTQNVHRQLTNHYRYVLSFRNLTTRSPGLLFESKRFSSTATATAKVHNNQDISQNRNAVAELSKDHHNASHSKKISLREYQVDSIEACLKSFKEGKSRVAISMATGSGKTVVFSHLLSQVQPKPGQGNKVLVLAHRKELIIQAQATIQKFNPDLKVEVEMAKFKSSPDADVIVASVPTIGNKRSNRLEQFDPKDFKLIIIDEAHHAAAGTYLRVLEHFDATSPDSSVYVAGFSATFERLDGLALTKAMDNIVYDNNVVKMIMEGHLSDFVVTTIKASYSLERFLEDDKKTKKDYDSATLDRLLNTEELNNFIYKTYIKMGQQCNSTLVFCSSVNHVKALCAIFKENGIDAAYIYAGTSDIERAQIIEGFRSGKIRVLFNCGILTEGTDIPNIDCIFLLRPTKSKALLMQMIGRGLRLHPGKKNCQILDFVGVTSAHKSRMATVPSLFGMDPDLVMEKAKMREEITKLEAENLELEEKKKSKSSRENDRLARLIRNCKLEEIQLETYKGIVQFLTDPSEDDDSKGQIEDSRLPIKQSKNNWLMLEPRHYILSSMNSYLSLDYVTEADIEASLSSSSSSSSKNKKKATKLTPGWMLESHHKIERPYRGRSQSETSMFTMWSSHERFSGIQSAISALNAADTYAKGFFSNPHIIKKQAKWRKEEPTEGQLSELKRQCEKVLKMERIKNLVKKLDDCKSLASQLRSESETTLSLSPSALDLQKTADTNEESNQDLHRTTTTIDHLDWVMEMNKGEVSDLLSKTARSSKVLTNKFKEYYQKMINFKKQEIDVYKRQQKNELKELKMAEKKKKNGNSL